MKRYVSLAPLAAAIFTLAACAASKSSNPLSPDVAGPIPGVAISAPTPTTPSAGSQISVTDQPITLKVQNATTTGVRPLSYSFQVASDSNFSNILFSKAGVSPGNGQTTATLTDTLAPEHMYYWRSQALDGANTGPYSGAVSFTVYTPVTINAPTLVSPIGGATVSSDTPTLTVNDASHSGPAGAITYLFQIAKDQAFTSGLVQHTSAEGSAQTSYTVGSALSDGTTYYWRVQASDGSHTSSWSSTASFVTPAASSGGGSSGGSSGGGSYSPAPGDQLDLSQVTVVLGPSGIAGWKATSTLTNITLSSSQICTGHTMAGRWPTVAFFGDPGTLIEGNQWYFANIGGKWYGGAGEWLRPGQTCKGVNVYNIGPDEFYNSSWEPLHSWKPQSGETIGIMVSTPARAWPGMETSDERSNVVLVKVP